MLDELLLVIGNGPGIVPFHVLTMRAEPTPKLSEPIFKNKVQDIPRCQTRCAKINCPSTGFVWSRLCEKNLLKDKFAAELAAHHY